jgi:hypothetical protein
MQGESDDGGLPPGGAPEQQPCDCGPCPACAEDVQRSSPCVLQLKHGGTHHCADRHEWDQAGPSATPLRRCGGPCQTPNCGWTCTRNMPHPTPHMCRLGHTW